VASFALDNGCEPLVWRMYTESKKWRREHGTVTAKPPRGTRAALIGNERVDGDVADVQDARKLVPPSELAETGRVLTRHHRCAATLIFL
jgi:hypothetical protein